MTWPGEPLSGGGVFLVGYKQMQWIMHALLHLKGQQDRLSAELADIRIFQQAPVRGRVTIQIGEVKPVTIPVHPTDQIAFSVAWENAEGQTIPETSATSWSVTDPAGNAATIGVFTVDATNDDRGTVAAPLSFGDYILVASTNNESGNAVKASSDTINVADTNVARGTVAVTVTPA